MKIGENTQITIDLKTIGLAVGGLVMMIGMWFTLQADIALAKELPEPVIERMEFDMKDELIRQTIMDTQDDVQEIKETLDKMDERLYEMQKEHR
jgi:ubiquinone biosynthesis protein UbiJ